MDLTLRKKFLIALACVFEFGIVQNAFAAPSYTIANAPSDVALGEVFTVYVVLHLDGNSSIGHEMSVSFTPGLLIAGEARELGVPPYQLNIGSGVRSIDNNNGIVDQFEAASFDPISPATSFIVGQLTFEAADIGEATIIGFFGNGAAVLDGAGVAIDGVVFESISINVISTPIATPTAAPICEGTFAACKRNRDCCSGLCVGTGTNKSCQASSTPTPTAWPTPTATGTPTATPICQDAFAACRKDTDCCSNFCRGKGQSRTCQP